MGIKHITGDIAPTEEQSIDGSITPRGQSISGFITKRGLEIDAEVGNSGPHNYEHLIHKPKINSVELIGDKSFPELGIRTISSSEILDILDI